MTSELHTDMKQINLEKLEIPLNAGVVYLTVLTLSTSLSNSCVCIPILIPQNVYAVTATRIKLSPKYRPV